MRNYKILYIGNSKKNTTSYYRSQALIRMGNNIILADPYEDLCDKLQGMISGFFHYRTGYRFLQSSICRWMAHLNFCNLDIDLVWVDSGELLGIDALMILKELKVPLILFNHDDPTGNRDRGRFSSLKQALGLYDLVTAVRIDMERELKNYCHGRVLRIWMTYDEVQHSHTLAMQPIPMQYQSDVCFIGTWMRHENRDEFLLKLIDRGLKVAIWGERWQKSPYWKKLKPYWRGGALSGADYVMAIQGAKICLGLLSKGNRDLHTTRTMEIPYAGGLLCAERTTEHLQLYRENEEAVFWADANECADKCLDLLAHPDKRERIRLAGMRRVLENKVGNEDICRQIISAVSL